MEQNFTPATEERSPFLQKHTASLRIWHWLTFLVMTAILLTVLFASTVLNPRQNIPVVQNVLKEKGVVVTNEQSWAVTHLYDDKMWELHKLLGYALVFLFLARFGVEFVQAKEDKMKAKLATALAAFKGPGNDKKEARHYLFVRISYSLFYLVLLIMAVTGLLIAFGADWGISGPTRHTIKEVHGFFQYLVYAFILVHLVGVVYTDRGKASGVISNMINGGN